jgi:hypothetical protein
MNLDIECLIQYLGGPDKLLGLIQTHCPDIMKSSRTIDYFNGISGGFLVHVLSFTGIKDTLSVMLTCKAWYQATRVRAFWDRRVLSAKLKYMELNPSKKRCIKAAMAFDPWLSAKGETETFRDHLEWVFASSCFLVASAHVNYLMVAQRKTQIGSSSMTVFTTDGVLYSCQWLENHDTRSGRCRTVAYNTNPGLQLLEREEYNAKIGHGKWNDANGNDFIGCLTSTDGTVWYPQGAGKWTLSDGTIIEGENVADRGKIIK